MDAEKVQVIYNGIDLDTFSPERDPGNLRSELSIPSTARLLTCIGQIGMRKGTDFVIKSFLELAEQFADIHLLLIGMRNSVKQEAIEYESNCHQLSENSAHCDRIHWLGRRSDVRKILSDTTLVLHGARQEPLGRVLLESNAVGVPYIATNVGGTSEIVAESSSELLLCEIDSVKDMAAKAHRLLKDPVFSSSIAAELRKMAVDRFDVNRCAAELDSLYRRLTRIVN